MKISDYFNKIEGTDDEEILLSGFAELADELVSDEDAAVIFTLPVVGKLFNAIVALGGSDSLESFRRQTEHYDNIKEWGITVFNLEKGLVSIHPGPKHMKIIFIAAAIIVGGVLLVKCRRKCKA